MKTILFLAAALLSTTSFADSCYVGSKTPVRYYEFSVNDYNGNEVFVYGTEAFTGSPSDKEAQKSQTCRRYAKVGQLCEVLRCFSDSYNPQCPNGGTYRCHRANNLAGEICGCY